MRSAALTAQSCNRVVSHRHTVPHRHTKFAHAPLKAHAHSQSSTAYTLVGTVNSRFLSRSIDCGRVSLVARSSSVDDIVRVATVGDTVTIHYTCKGADGQVLDSSREEGEPLSFEVGAGDVMGNKLFQGFDEAVRGMAAGQTTELEATGGDWNKDLLFSVPRDHPEVQRLEGRYKNHGGLKEGMIVELANTSLAVCVSLNPESVVIDGNNMMAGKHLIFELEIMAVDKPEV